MSPQSEFADWDETSLTECVKLASGYIGAELRPMGLAMLLKYALWVKDNQKIAPFHFDEISIMYNRINGAPCMTQGDTNELYHMIGHLNALSELVRENLLN